MAHFALVKNGVVQVVYGVVNDVITDADGVEQENLGQEFLAELYKENPEDFVQCSYSGTFRGNYPGVGFIYDESLELFLLPKPFNSWILDEETYGWVAPIPYPNDGGSYEWNETTGEWVEVTDA